MVKYQLPHTRVDQISDHKHDIYLYGKLLTKLLPQAANKNTNFMFMKLDGCFFLKYGFISDCLENSKQTLVEKVTVQELVTGFCTVILIIKLRTGYLPNIYS